MESSVVVPRRQTTVLMDTTAPVIESSLVLLEPGWSHSPDKQLSALVPLAQPVQPVSLLTITWTVSPVSTAVPEPRPQDPTMTALNKEACANPVLIA
jgi:hypothetical protein